MENMHNKAETSFAPKGKQFGNYQLLQMLSQSDVADVHLAKHVRMQVPVAIKCLHGRFVGDAAEDFLRQYAPLARLHHPHILSILDHGIIDETAFVASAYVSKGTLRQYHPKNTRVAPRKVLDYVQQIGEALVYVHDQGLVHRDVKPQNILMDERERLLLTDFGAMVESSSLHPRQVCLYEFEGTILYAAPEQLQGKPCRRSDQYALAVMAYEWLCGSWPFTGTFYEVAHQHLFVPPPPLAEKGYVCPPNVEQVIFKALEKDPARRFRTVKQFADELAWAFKVAQAKGLLESGPSNRLLPLKSVSSTQPLPLESGLATQSLPLEPQKVTDPNTEQSRGIGQTSVQPRRQFKSVFPQHKTPDKSSGTPLTGG